MEEELRSLREQLDYSRRLFRLQCEELFDLESQSEKMGRKMRIEFRYASE